MRSYISVFFLLIFLSTCSVPRIQQRARHTALPLEVWFAPHHHHLDFLSHLLKNLKGLPHQSEVEWSESRSVMSGSLWPHGLYSPWNSPGQNTGVVALPFSRGSSQLRVESRSLTLQVDSLPAEPQGKPKILEWVAYPISSGSSQPRNWTGVSCIAGRFFTNWAIREEGLKNTHTHTNYGSQFIELSWWTCTGSTAIPKWLHISPPWVIT